MKRFSSGMAIATVLVAFSLLVVSQSRTTWPWVNVKKLSLNDVAVTATAAELNTLDGVTATVTELNYSDVASLGTVEASKAVTADANEDVTGIGNVTIPQKSTAGTASESGGNGNDIKNFTGVPKISAWSTGAGVNGTTNTVSGYIDDTPAGEWTGTTNVTDSTETTVFRKGTGALKLAFTAAAVAGNGADNTLSGGDEDWTDDASFGFWIYTDTALTAGYLVLEITDSGAGATTVNVPAVSTVNQWTWVECDVSAVANASKDVVQSIAIDLSSAGATALGAFNVYLDAAYKWDDADEEALSIDVYEDGAFAVMSVATAENAVNTVTPLVEGTDYFIHYETGNDFLVAIADNSAKSIFGLAALE